jgi:hypothetical protein
LTPEAVAALVAGWSEPYQKAVLAEVLSLMPASRLVAFARKLLREFAPGAHVLSREQLFDSLGAAQANGLELGREQGRKTGRRPKRQATLELGKKVYEYQIANPGGWSWRTAAIRFAGGNSPANRSKCRRARDAYCGDADLPRPPDPADVRRQAEDA